MVGAGAFKLRGELCATRSGQLIGVQMADEPRLPAGLQRRPALVRVEGALLEKSVAAARPLARRLRNQLLDHGSQPIDAVRVRRHRVQGEEGREHFASRPAAGSARDAQEPQLLIDAQSVAGLHLDRGHAAAHQARESLARAGEQLVVGSRARGFYRAADSPARLRDLRIRRTRQPLRVLPGAVAGSLVSTRSSRLAAAGVPSATITWPACSEYPMPTPPP